MLACCGPPLTLQAAAPTMDQTFNLVPGWNAIFLEVTPTDPSTDAVLAGLDVVSMWSWNPQISSKDFIKESVEEAWNDPGWLRYFPPSQVESMFTNLHEMHAFRAYLIKMNSSGVLSVTGTPKPGAIRWTPNAYTLTGFPVNPAASPSFVDFFAAEPALAGQPVYQLDPNGTWSLLTNPQATIQPGEAYWVYCDGVTDFVAPLVVDLDGDMLDFDYSVGQLPLSLKSSCSGVSGLSVQILGSATLPPISYRLVDPVTAAVSWPQLPNPHLILTAQNEKEMLMLSARRGEFTGETTCILAVSDTCGSRRLIPLRAAASAATKRKQTGAFMPTQGLWSGMVTLEAVSQINSAPDTPQPTATSTSFRLIVHVDETGQARLLKDVIKMWQDGTFEPDPERPGMTRPATPGEDVLLTDDSLVSAYSGVTMAGGVEQGFRLSTVGYDFAGDKLDMTTDDIEGTLACTLNLGFDHPTNPFMHRRHPDHDNRSADGQSTVQEAYPITREITLTFETSDPFGSNSPDWGYREFGGIYAETITGLYQKDLTGQQLDHIMVEGRFILHRVSPKGVLNE